MKTIEVDGKSIKTNLHEFYQYSSGDDKRTMSMYIKKDCRESDEEMFNRLVGYGYTTITFYNRSKRVRGHFDVIAYCKRPKRKQYSFILVLRDGTKKPFYCQKNELKSYMSAYELEQQDYIFILNDGLDKVQHKPFNVK